jgi:hypothetical protein
MRTSVLVRPAARGGKFLGPDAADGRGVSARVAISDLSNGHMLAEAEVNTAGRDAGPADIMAPVGRAQPYATDALTVGATLAVDIDRPTVVRVTVRGPLSHPDQAREAQADFLLLPGIDIGTGTDPQGIVVEIPGLCLSDGTLDIADGQVACSAMVTMMCGCEIQGSPTWFWPSDAFVVQLATRTRGGATQSYALGFDTTPGAKSRFAGRWPDAAPAGDPVVEAWLLASQPTMGNQGRLRLR